MLSPGPYKRLAGILLTDAVIRETAGRVRRATGSVFGVIADKDFIAVVIFTLREIACPFKFSGNSDVSNSLWS
jgi:uncharacterized membrane protein required for colicin V production